MLFLYYGTSPREANEPGPARRNEPAPFEKGFAEHLEEHRDRYVADRIERDRRAEAFFTDVEAILHEPNPEGMARARRAYERLLLRRGSGDLPAARVDLVQLVMDLPLSDESYVVVEPWLVSFEQKLVEGLRANDAAYMKYWVGMQQTANPWLERAKEVPEEQYELRDEMLQRYYREGESLRLSLFVHKKQLHDLVLAGLREVIAALSAEEVDELQKRFDEIAFDLIYPDVTSAESLYAVALAIQNLEDWQREAIVARRDLYRDEHSELCDRMEWLWLSQRMATGLPVNRMQEQQGRFLGEFREAGFEREYLNEDQLDALRTILTPEQMERLPKWNFDEDPPRRPWDPPSDGRRRKGYERNRLRNSHDR